MLKSNRAPSNSVQVFLFNMIYNQNQRWAASHVTSLSHVFKFWSVTVANLPRVCRDRGVTVTGLFGCDKRLKWEYNYPVGGKWVMTNPHEPLKFKISNPLTRIRHRKSAARGRMCSQNLALKNLNHTWNTNFSSLSQLPVTSLSLSLVCHAFFVTRMSLTLPSQIFSNQSVSLSLVCHD